MPASIPSETHVITYYNTPMHGYNEVQAAVHFIRQQTTKTPTISLTLGSGLGGMAAEVERGMHIPYGDIPHFPVSTAPGHAGEMVIGDLAGKSVIVFKGRIHAYEGYNNDQVIFPTRVAHALGARTFVLTNACGGLRDDWNAGDLMLHNDFINFTGTNALIGKNDPRFGERFPGMFDAYYPEYRELVKRIAREQNLDLREGVYLGISGPSYASRAELRMYRLLGADAIGMSTVPEVLAARHLNAKVIGLSTVTDLAIPEREHHATQQEVLDVAKRTTDRFKVLLRELIQRL